MKIFLVVSAEFLKVFEGFLQVLLGFPLPKGFRKVSAFCADFDSFCMGFCMVSAEFCNL